MEQSTGYIVITDVGSTTTKAILLDRSYPIPRILGIHNCPTTVEEPVNDVRIGVAASIRGLERDCGISLLTGEVGGHELKFMDGIKYYSTSSAGGGLQILVIGLTLFDSASSARRAAYGAGGIILDTFALDDKRTAISQMLAMRNLHPDMILLCGGVDGGALTGVLRLAEILRVARPMPKFDSESKIPTIYAGNKDAAHMISEMISSEFDLHILPNLRPSLSHENLGPTQDTIQKLFMENVMENAPGYAFLKKTVAAPVIPTPLGVLNSLKHISGNAVRNVFAFDIGGATTDVFSYIHNRYQRTVSANLGMSYSILNVAKECGWDNVLRWLPDGIGEDQGRNYVANKCLDPVSLPGSIDEVRIEHAIAREAIRMALAQHQEMHFNIEKTNYLNKLFEGKADKYDLLFEYQEEMEKLYFRESDIDVIIGAGGIFAHAADPGLSVLTLIDAIQPKGITEICVDKDFTTPHLGVLGLAEPAMAKALLDVCVQKLAIHISPILMTTKPKNPVLVRIETPDGTADIALGCGEFHYYPAGKKHVSVKCSGKAYLKDKLHETSFDTDLPVILDTRTDFWVDTPARESLLAKNDEMALGWHPKHTDQQVPVIRRGEWIHKIALPYQGDINVIEGQSVSPDDIVACNPHDPPRLFLVDVFKAHHDMDPDTIKASLLVKLGDLIEFNQVLARIPDHIELPHYLRHARKILSPVRGVVAYIEFATGILVINETQDYSLKPVTIDMAAQLGVPPKQINRYMKVLAGDFVFKGDLIASLIVGSKTVFIHAPSTGTVEAVDTRSGQVVIQYKHKRANYLADVYGKVVEIKERQEISIQYTGMRMEGRIAFGRNCHGALRVAAAEAAIDFSGLDGAVLALGFSPDLSLLNKLAQTGLRGLVCFSVQARVLSGFLGYDPGVINTGDEELPYTLMLLGSFGDLPMPEQTLSSLAKYISQNVWLSPHTRIRAGVVRPFIKDRCT